MRGTLRHQNRRLRLSVFGLESVLKGKDLPKYTDKKVRAYNRDQLDKMFAIADQEESDLLQFFFCTGVASRRHSMSAGRMSTSSLRRIPSLSTLTWAIVPKIKRGDHSPSPTCWSTS
jgi:hypothetical protein